MSFPSLPDALTIPTRAVGTGDPAGDMNALVAAYNRLREYVQSLGLRLGDKIWAVDYGVSATATPEANAAGINLAIRDGAAQKKPIELPHGDLQISSSINLDTRTCLSGVGRYSTRLVATAAMAYMVGYTGDNLYEPVGMIAEKFSLIGNNLVPTLFELHSSAFFKVDMIFGEGYTDIGLVTRGCLSGVFDHIMLRGGNSGYLFTNRDGVRTNNGTSSPITMPANNLTLINSSLGNSRKRIMEFSYGAGLTVLNFDAENNGQGNNKSISQIYCHHLCEQGEGMGLDWSGKWGEIEYGGFLFEFAPSLGTCLNIIRTFQYNGAAGDSLGGIKISSDSHVNNLSVYATQIKNLQANGVNGGTNSSAGAGSAGMALVADGANTKVWIQPDCNLTEGTTATNGATITVIGGAASTGASTAPVAGTGPKYTTLVAQDSPLYYNRMVAGAGANSIAPTVGTGALSLSNGAAAGNTDTALQFDNTSGCVLFDGNDDLAQVSLDLSSYKQVLIMAWMNLDTGQTSGNAWKFGTPDWTRPGGFVFAPSLSDGGANNGNNLFSLAGSGGNASDASIIGPYPRAIQSGWQHVAIHYTTTGVARYIVNGVQQTITTSTPNNTNSYASDVLSLFTTLKGKMQEVSIWAGNSASALPTTAQVKKYYDARYNAGQ